MLTASYKAKFHDFSRYATQMLGTMEERIQLYVKVFNTNLLILTLHDTFVGKSFIEVSENVKKLKRVQQVGQAKVLAKKPQNVGNFNSLYSWDNN